MLFHFSAYNFCIDKPSFSKSKFTNFSPSYSSATPSAPPAFHRCYSLCLKVFSISLLTYSLHFRLDTTSFKKPVLHIAQHPALIPVRVSPPCLPIVSVLSSLPGSP